MRKILILAGLACVGLSACSKQPGIDNSAIPPVTDKAQWTKASEDHSGKDRRSKKGGEAPDKLAK